MDFERNCCQWFVRQKGEYDIPYFGKNHLNQIVHQWGILPHIFSARLNRPNSNEEGRNNYGLTSHKRKWIKIFCRTLRLWQE